MARVVGSARLGTDFASRSKTRIPRGRPARHRVRFGCQRTRERRTCKLLQPAVDIREPSHTHDSRTRTIPNGPSRQPITGMHMRLGRLVRSVLSDDRRFYRKKALFW